MKVWSTTECYDTGLDSNAFLSRKTYRSILMDHCVWEFWRLGFGTLMMLLKEAC